MKLKIIIASIIVILLIGIGIIWSKYNKAKEELNTAIINNKAYQAELNNAKEQSYMFQLTAQQLQQANDSISQKLKEAVGKVEIREKEVIQYQYIETYTHTTDTVEFRDTIFQNDVAIDTVIGDNWYNVDLSLKYPDTLVVSPKFKNETIVLISSQKETVDPPKKCWLLRLFQKKHTVVKVDVIENNPYSEVKEQRFIEIIK